MTSFREKMFSPFVQKELQTEWRGREISRIEGFSDAVFGFAVTLLVVALEVPRTSGELFETMSGFGSFLVTFAILFSIWYRQFIFFRRYGLEDKTTVVLNGCLIVVVLFFVYPLKFLFSALIARMAGHRFTTLANGTVVPILRAEHFPYLLAIYGFGLAAVYVVFALLYRHAYRNRDVLKLSEIEAYDTNDAFNTNVWVAAVGMVIGFASAVAGVMKVFETDAGQLIIAAVEIIAVFKLVRIRRSRRRRREEFLTSLSAQTAGTT